MMELAVIERYIYQALSGPFADMGIAVEVGPFRLEQLQGADAAIRLPVCYFQYVSATDRNAMGPGARLMTSALYEIGIFHDRTTFGGSFSTTAGAKTLVELMTIIDEAFQDYATPANQEGGVIFSVERESPIRIPERGGDGKVYRRDGGLFRFHARKE